MRRGHAHSHVEDVTDATAGGRLQMSIWKCRMPSRAIVACTHCPSLPFCCPSLSADATVKFGGARDFNAATAGALRTAYKKVANANNLFSELPHHPRAAFVPKDPKALQPFNMPVDFQEHAAAIHEHTAGLASGTVRAAPLQLQELAVHGQQRYKFFRQPHTLVLNTALLKA